MKFSYQYLHFGTYTGEYKGCNCNFAHWFRFSAQAAVSFSTYAILYLQEPMSESMLKCSVGSSQDGLSHKLSRRKQFFYISLHKMLQGAQFEIPPNKL